MYTPEVEQRVGLPLKNGGKGLEDDPASYCETVTFQLSWWFFLTQPSWTLKGLFSLLNM